MPSCCQGRHAGACDVVVGPTGGKLGLAWNVVRISPERQAQRQAAGPCIDVAA